MKILSDKAKLAKILLGKKKIGFVPTMGGIHEGHISLIKKSISLCNISIVSIYVNKPQFNNKNDYKRYPRRLKKDIPILRKNKVDLLYLPKTNQIYPKGTNKEIKIHSFSKQLCGKYRPGHFEAIVDVIDKFIKIIKPSKIFLGKKDMQQLKIIEEFVKRNKLKTTIVGCKTVRGKNGIAFSSRNYLLSSKQLIIASKVFKLVSSKKRDIIIKKITPNQIKNKIFRMGIKKIDYLKILDINKLIKPYKKNNDYKIFIAYHLGSTRLIDNI